MVAPGQLMYIFLIDCSVRNMTISSSVLKYLLLVNLVSRAVISQLMIGVDGEVGKKNTSHSKGYQLNRHYTKGKFCLR